MLMIDTEDARTVKALEIAADAGQWDQGALEGRPATRVRRAITAQCERALPGDHAQLPLRRLQTAPAAVQARQGSCHLRRAQAGLRARPSPNGLGCASSSEVARRQPECVWIGP